MKLIAEDSLIPSHSEYSLYRFPSPTLIMLPAWTASYSHAPRRSHEQTSSEFQQGRTSTSNEQREPRRRTSSDSTPRQTAASTRFLNNVNEQEVDRNVLSSNGTMGSDALTSSRRLGFFADKISSSLSGGSSGANLKGPSQLLHPHSHTKADSSSTTPPSISPSNSLMNPSSSTINLPKAHTSPSKVRRSQLPYHLPLTFCRVHMGVHMTQNSLVGKCTDWLLSCHQPLR